MRQPSPYRKAWIFYKKSPDYKRSSNALKKRGIKQPYRDNILQSAFAEGWNYGKGYEYMKNLNRE